MYNYLIIIICNLLFFSFFLSSPTAAPKVKPTVVADYNEHMNGVNRMDQLSSYYSFLYKSVKWWRKVFFWTIEVAMVNSYIVHRKVQQSLGMPSFCHVKFQREILTGLCQPLIDVPKPSNRPSQDLTLERLQNTEHFCKKMMKRKDYHVCSSREAGQERYTTQYICTTCSDSPSLCSGDCFQ